MEKFQYIPLGNLLAKYHRDFRGLDINESDGMAWIGEALGFMKIASASEEAVAYVEVKNYQCDMPANLHYLIQIARDNYWTSTTETNDSPSTIITAYESPPTSDCATCGDYIAVDCFGIPIGDEEQTYYMPYFDLQGEYYAWRNTEYYRTRYTPVVLGNHTFFSSLVCREVDDAIYDNQVNLMDEYTIAGNQLRFSFQEGFVAIAYLRQRMDADTGYPLVPDDEYARAAITYYMTWKIKQRECYSHRQGACELADRAEIKWMSYIKKFKNKAKMPVGVDQHQNLSQQSRYLIPRMNRYYGFFGNLGRPEQRPFNNPRNRIY